MNQVFVRLGRAFAASLLLLLAFSAVAYAADLGHKDVPYVSGSGGIAGSKPESKLWFNDGLWWGSIWDDSTKTFYIYKLDPGTDSWVKTSSRLDDRKGSRADTLWDGTKLYVATQVQNDAAGGGSSNQARLYRFSYNSSTKTYSNDAGGTSAFAIIRTGSRLETFVIAKDTANTLWATWTEPSGSDRLVFTSHSIGGNDASWTNGVVLPVGGQVGVTTDADDVSSIIAFKVDSTHTGVGVFWSNQIATRDYFAYHVDGAADTAWTAETAIQPHGNNTKPADDHMNLKTDSTGRVFAAIKNSNNSSGTPETELLVRPAGGGSWAEYVVTTGNGNNNTRPIVVLDESGNTLHYFFTGPQAPDTTGVGGGIIYEKTSSMSSISLTGSGTPVIRDDTAPFASGNSKGPNDATSSKQNATSTSGIVVLASEDGDESAAPGHRTYWHFSSSAGGGGGGAPVADFTADVTTGTAPLTVHFTDASTNSPTSWAWDFENNGSVDDTTQNPTHIFSTAGQYTVKLTATNGTGPGSVTKTNYITASTGGGTATINLPADADTQVKVGSTTNLGANAQLRTREENPVASSTYRSYLRFNVQGLTGTPNTVTLKLWVDTASTNTQTVYNTTSLPNWPELTTNGTNAPGIGSTVLGSATASPAGAYKDYVLAPTSVGGNGLVTFALKSNGTTSAYFSSKEGAHPPQLVLTQTVVSNPPVADFSGTPTTGTPGLNVQFTDLSTNTPTGWDWDFGDSTSHGNTKNPSHVYAAAGPYTVTLIASNGSGPSTPVSKVAYINIGDAPVASFTTDVSSGTAPLQVTFTDTSSNSPTSWAWDFDNNGTVDDTTQNPVHTYASGATFTAKLTATNAFGGTSTTQQIVVTGPPTADFSGTPLTIHPGDSVQFTDLSSGTGPITWAWDFGDGGTATTQNPSHIYAGAGTFTVALTATNGAGPNTRTRTNYVNVGSVPVAAFAATPDNGTAPLTVNFSNTSSGTGPLTYAWDFDNNGTVDSTAATPSHSFAAGPYTVKLTVTSPFGSDSTTHPVTVTGGTPTTITLNPSEDAQVNAANSTNYGTLTPFRTREENPVASSTYRLFFKFIVPTFSGSVSSVKLRLYVTTASANTQSVYSVANTWAEGTIGGLNAPAIGNTVLGSAAATPVNSYIDFTLPLNSVTSNQTFSFAVKSSGTTSAYFNSRESATNKPQLVIVAGP